MQEFRITLTNNYCLSPFNVTGRWPTAANPWSPTDFNGGVRDIEPVGVAGQDDPAAIATQLSCQWTSPSSRPALSALWTVETLTWHRRARVR